MTPKRILYIHHAKNFESNDAYKQDNFIEANRKLFGAQELDTWAGIRLISQAYSIFRLQISINLRRYQVVHDGDVIEEGPIDLNLSSKKYLRPRFWKALLKYRDSAIATNVDPFLKSRIERLIKRFDISFAWVDTQFYDFLIPESFPSLVRSVNFEPVHVLREDNSIFRSLKAFLKILSERKLVQNRNLITISPNDAIAYRRISGRDCDVLPLRQLPFLLDLQSHIDSKGEILDARASYVYFSGSSFDVNHNRKNLRFVLYELAPQLKEVFPSLKILVFGHRFPNGWQCPDNVMRMDFQFSYFDMIAGSVAALVPNRGGAGMQSKVFEPICLGIPLIANPDALAGYPFSVGNDYYDGSGCSSIIESLVAILSNDNEAHEKASKAQEKARILFRKELIECEVKTNVSKL